MIYFQTFGVGLGAEKFIENMNIIYKSWGKSPHLMTY